ncbi:beta-galactosidase GalA [Dinghuibacter silviterrae]|uniref:Beta-galactosidase n=1 Tax=Dinghuibacter silviterrae TaxID=1539049 RepID=A0A4R8DTA0_9BACT|nr:beta-galactosidase GalA [Dinghuibacter silviterrae]TDX01500.1 beta-galactosidase [Dinghuibacter silviterrae]
MKKLCWIALFAATVSSVRAQNMRSRDNFDEGWKFHLGSNVDYTKDFGYGQDLIYAKTGDAGHTPASPHFKDADWESVRLPHDWAITLPFVYKKDGDLEGHGFRQTGPLFPESNVGWYRKTFTVHRSDSGGRFVVTFDGIFRDSRIWINGYYLGSNLSGYSGISFDITDFLWFDKPNVITVRADASQYEGWFYEGAGIYRHVWLERFNNLHLAHEGGVFVHTDDNKVTVEATLDNKGLAPAGAQVSAYITDRSGAVVAQTDAAPVQVAVDGSQTVKLSATLATPHLWNLDDPYLYRAVVLVKDGDRVIDSSLTRFGVRTITVDADKGLFLNGKPIKIQGVCCHQDHAGVGAAMPDFLQYYRIAVLKEMGTNAYRTSHNPPTPELLDACDSLGMLVLDETRLLDSGPEYEAQFKHLLLRDRSRPCVFMWSIGNEEWVAQTNSIGKRIAQNQVLLAHELDPTRLCTEAVNDGNVFHGVNEVLPVRGFNYNLHGVDPYRKEHPTQPIMGTEVASTVSTRGIYIRDTPNAYVPDYDSCYPPWASTAETWWTLAADRPWFMGGFAWTGFDYRGEPTPYGWPNINSHFGIMDMCGFPKNVYYYYKSWWTDGNFIHLSPHWNWKGSEGKVIKVWVNTSCKDVELYLNGKSLGKKEMPRNGHLYWFVKYKPGTLKAVGHSFGEPSRRIEEVVSTTGDPLKVVLTPYRKVIMNDGRDGTILNVTVLDAKGLEVPDAMNLIHFSLSGNARFIGVGNGDPSSHEPDLCPDGQWQRRLFNGKCQVILQSDGKGTGPIQVQANGDGLQGASVELQAVGS